MPAWVLNLGSIESCDKVCDTLTKATAIEVSDAILGQTSETPYDDLKVSILRRSQHGKEEDVTLLLPQQSAEFRLLEPLRVYNQPSGEHTLVQHSHLEASPFSYEPVGTDTVT